MRRNVEILARILEGDLPFEGADAGVARLALLAAQVEDRATPTARLDPARRAALRASLVEAARVQFDGRGSVSGLKALVEDTRTRWRTRVGAVASAAALVLSGGGVVLAAEEAGPANPLYGVKLALEDVRLALTTSEMQRGGRELDYAAERVREAWTAAQVEDEDGASRALEEANHSTRTAVGVLASTFDATRDPRLLTEIEVFLVGVRGRVQAMPVETPRAVTARDELMIVFARVTDVVGHISGRAPNVACDAASLRARNFEIPPADEPFVVCAPAAAPPASIGPTLPPTPDPGRDPAAVPAPALDPAAPGGEPVPSGEPVPNDTPSAPPPAPSPPPSTAPSPAPPPSVPPVVPSQPPPDQPPTAPPVPGGDAVPPPPGSNSETSPTPPVTVTDPPSVSGPSVPSEPPSAPAADDLGI